MDDYLHRKFSVESKAYSESTIVNGIRLIIFLSACLKSWLGKMTVNERSPKQVYTDCYSAVFSGAVAIPLQSPAFPLEHWTNPCYFGLMQIQVIVSQSESKLGLHWIRLYCTTENFLILNDNWLLYNGRDIITTRCQWACRSLVCVLSFHFFKK